MKKLITTVLALGLVASSLAACGASESSSALKTRTKNAVLVTSTVMSPPGPFCQVSLNGSTFRICRPMKSIDTVYLDSNGKPVSSSMGYGFAEGLNDNTYVNIRLNPAPLTAAFLEFSVRFRDGRSGSGRIAMNSTSFVEMRGVISATTTTTLVPTTTTTTTTLAPTTTTTVAPKTCAVRFYSRLMYWCKQAKSWNYAFVVNGVPGEIAYGDYASANRGNNIQLPPQPAGTSAIVLSVQFDDGSIIDRAEVPFNKPFFAPLK